MKPSYQTFLNEMFQHGDKYRAYKAAYPKASGNALKVAANRLLRRHEIKEQLQQANEKARAKAITVLEQETLHYTQQQFTSISQKRAILHQMITGQWQVERQVKLNNKIETVVEKLNPYAVLRAIALDIKLEQKQQALERAKNIEPPKQQKEPVVEGKPLYQHPQREPYPKNGTAEQLCQWHKQYDGEGRCWVTQQNVFVYERSDSKIIARVQLTPQQADNTTLRRELPIAPPQNVEEEPIEEEELSTTHIEENSSNAAQELRAESSDWDKYVSLGGIAGNLNLDTTRLKQNFLNRSPKQRQQLIAPLLGGNKKKQKQAS